VDVLGIMFYLQYYSVLWCCQPCSREIPSLADPARIVTPEKTIRPIKLCPAEIAPWIGRPVSDAMATMAKYVPSIAPRSCVWPPATSTRHGVISETKAPEKKPKNRVNTTRPPNEW
jgi:hypothetical protein